MRGINLVGMEGPYSGSGVAGSHWSRLVGPRAGTDYPVHSPALIDYYRSKNVRVIRLLFSWERLQSRLWGPVPAVGTGYAAYAANLAAVVEYATGLGITVILEPWQADSAGRAGGACWRGRTVGSDDVDIFAFADFWSKLVALYSDNKLVEYGLVNEPHDMSTMAWWAIAQKCVDAIRAAGATTTIHVPGNGYTAASTWTETGYDTASPKRSNAYGWLNANGADHPLFDPLGRCVAEVHVYFDPDGSGSSTAIAGPMVAKAAVATAAMEAAARGYRVFVGEIGCFAGVPGATQAWSEFVAYIGQHPSTCAGFAWWAGGSPGYWDDVAADGGGHFSVTPIQTPAGFADTVNMTMIKNDLG